MKNSQTYPKLNTRHNNLYGSVLSHSSVKFPYMPSFASSPYESGMDSSAPNGGYFSQSDVGLYSHSDLEGSITSDQEYLTDLDNREERAILQATVFVEDAIEHRSIHHKVDTDSLTKYRLYHSKLIRWVLRITIALLLALAFFETPSSLTISSDPRKRGERYKVPCGVTETVELACLVILSMDMFFKVLMVGVRQAKKTNWLIATFLVLAVSYLDWFVSISYICDERWRVRRLLRPFFLIQNSSLMKKTVQSIQRSVPQILSVLFLMALHVYFFTMLGMVLFTPEDLIFNATEIHAHESKKTYHRHSIDILNDQNEGKAYFGDTGAAVISLLVLLTTANNPDVMMPAYSDNRLYALYFILFLAIGMYFFLNVLLAVMYNQFKGSFTKSLQSSFMRRRVGIRAAFEVLRATTFYSSPLESPRNSVDVSLIRQVIEKIRFSKKSRYLPFFDKAIDKLQTPTVNAKQFQDIFDIVFKDSVKTRPDCRQFADNSIPKKIQDILLHTYFQYFGDFMSLLNVLVVTVELANSVTHAFSGHSMLSIFNFCFIFYYAIEQAMMIYFIGPKRYFSHKNVWFESCVTWLLVVVEILCIALYGGPFPYLTEEEIIQRSQKFEILSLYNLLRMTNMLIIIRLLRIIPSIKPLFMVASTLVDLIKNMRAFGGIVIMIYYVFAILGMMVFEGKSPPPPPTVNSTVYQANLTCGTYEQLEYYANNFDDFAASLVVLWDVMVVNNWFVFLHAYNRTTSSRFTQIYFIIWWLISAVISINLFVALVIEAFITQWERSEKRIAQPQKKHKKRKFAHNEETSRHFRVHEMFRADYREPTEEEMLKEIFSHPYLRRYTLTQRDALND